MYSHCSTLYWHCTVVHCPGIALQCIVLALHWRASCNILDSSQAQLQCIVLTNCIVLALHCTTLYWHCTAVHCAGIALQCIVLALHCSGLYWHCIGGLPVTFSIPVRLSVQLGLVQLSLVQFSLVQLSLVQFRLVHQPYWATFSTWMPLRFWKSHGRPTLLGDFFDVDTLAPIWKSHG